MREITSAANPAVKDARALQTAKGRAEQHAFLLDGEHMVAEALCACPESVQTLFVENGRAERFQAILAQAERAGAAVYAVPAHILASLSQVKTSQGVAAVCAMPKPASLDALGERVLLLENVQDPGNVGTMLRTLDAAGFTGCVLTPGCADLFAPKTLRATMGSVFRVPVAYGGAAECALSLRCAGYATIAAALDGTPFYSRDALPDKLCVLIGNEGAGLSAEAVAACAYRYRLPMNGGAESLNAAVAAAIIMYELVNHQ